MSADILAILLRATLTASAAILVILALRAPFRALFGAQVAYALWLLAPIALIASFLPARRIYMQTAAASDAAQSAANAGPIDPAMLDSSAPIIQAAAPQIAPWVLLVWLAGVTFSVLLIAYGQRRFLRNSERAGPAVVGIIAPRIVLPADFNQRYTPAERDLVIAHERAHIEAFDAQINAFAALLQCLNWFNPLFHIARSALRVDQELACDARVMARHANAKRTYAEAMLKTQLAAQTLPLGCQWPPLGAQPLKERITMLTRPRPTAFRLSAGIALCAMAIISAGTLAGATQAPRITHVSTQQSTAATTAAGARGRELVGALQEGRMVQARELVEAGADVNYYLQGDGTPLVIAARFGSREMVEYLIAHGANVNLAARGDGNPLIMASMFGHLEVAELLVQRGADVNGIAVDDETPLINAARSNRLAVARYLIAQGADVNLAVDAMTSRGMERRSPLSEARRRGHTQMTSLLLEHGATR